ncbi:MAG: hypothetical protein JWP79_2499 [Polaromonas sp.]|nr:hypothetical protein [Polaromonas sp.]MDB5845189.1 hypothetical protein [Polaromonas sp.]MDB5938511.1 hypothetical protein [Polaromonas sp.]
MTALAMLPPRPDAAHPDDCARQAFKVASPVPLRSPAPVAGALSCGAARNILNRDLTHEHFLVLCT